MTNESACADFYFAAHDTPGWLNLFNLSNGVVDCLTSLDQAYIRVWKGVDALKKELAFEYETGLLGVWEEDVQGRLDLINKLIADFESDYAAAQQSGVSAINRLVMSQAAQYDLLLKTRKKLSAAHASSQGGSSAVIPGRLPESQVAAAKAVPLESIVELDAHNKVICPFHDDEHPSMLVKNGFGYCFTCSKSCDTIGWLMKVEGMSFPDAVRRLAP